MTYARQGSTSFEVRLHNVSVEGARLEAENPPPVGVDVNLLYLDLESRARVTWVDENTFGVEFHFPLDESEIPADALTPPKGRRRKISN